MININYKIQSFLYKMKKNNTKKKMEKIYIFIINILKIVKILKTIKL